MEKRFITLFIVLLTLPFFAENALAHPGRTDSNGGHTCRTNCAKWGLQTGEYHYHNGSSSSSSSSSPAPAIITPLKSVYDQADIDEGEAVGLSSGFDDGYNRNSINAITNTGNESFKIGYATGYEAGYHDGLSKIKEEDIAEGTQDGETEGRNASQVGEERDVQTNNSKSSDWNSAYKVAFIKSFDYEKNIKESEKLGSELGYSLAELVIPAKFTTDEGIKRKFEVNYNIGYSKRIKEERDKQFEIGSKDGYALSALMISSIDDRFVKSYEKGYEEGKSQRKEEIMNDGNESAFININYQEKEEYNNSELSGWYKQGFDSNEVANKIKETALDNGYKNSEYMIPDEFVINDKSIALYDSLFEEGQKLRKQEKQKKMMIAAGIVIPASGITVGGLFFSKRKKKKAEF